MDRPPTTLTGVPATVRPSTLEEPEATLSPPLQLTVCRTATCPTLIADAPENAAESSLALAERVPAAASVAARGSVTLNPPPEDTPVSSWLSLTHGMAPGLATTGSKVTCCGPEARAALARQELPAACAFAGAPA